MKLLKTKKKEIADHEEIKKREYGIDIKRCRKAYKHNQQLSQQFSQKINENYFHYPLEIIENNKCAVSKFLKKTNSKIIIPTRESGEAISPTLFYLIKLVNPKNILVVCDDCDEIAIKTIAKYNVNYLFTDEILELLDSTSLYQILHMADFPKGKGTALFTGSILEYMLQQTHPSEWFIFYDSEARNPHTYRALETMAYGASGKANVQYVQTARGGRNNEVPMAARVLLSHLGADWPNIDIRIRQRANQLYHRLTPHKWMLSGEFMINKDWLFAIPMLSGYLIETMVATCAEDFNASKESTSIFVEALDCRLDQANDFIKEEIMMQTIASFILNLALLGNSPLEWSLEMIAELNKKLPICNDFYSVIIPPCEGPLEARVVYPEKIWPSVSMIFEKNLIHKEKADIFLEKFI